MDGLTRSREFLKGRADRPPFHPIVMRWAARYAGIPYGAFCQVAERKAEGMVRSAEDFDMDWVTVMSDPYVEAEAFGLRIAFPEDDLPVERGPLLCTLDDLPKLRLPVLENSRRMMNTVATVQRLCERTPDRLVVGWVEGALAEYADLRGLSATCMDLYDAPEAVDAALDVLQENAVRFARAQVAAGAHCIGIGDAVCSQVGPELYARFAFPREKALVEAVHGMGALAKLHICGNIGAILPRMAETGADLIDVDSLAGDLAPYAALLRPGQVYCGNHDPVRVLRDGDAAAIEAAVRRADAATGGRTVVSAGCEITPDTTVENMAAFSRAAKTTGCGGNGGTRAG